MEENEIEEINLEIEKEAKDLKNKLQNTPEDLFKIWEKDPSPKNMSSILNCFNPLLNKTLQRYRSNPIDDQIILGDLKSHFVDAVETYDPKKGVKLITHIFPHLQKTSRFVQQNSGAIRIPENQLSNIRNFNQAKDDLKRNLNRDPLIDEIADEMGLPIKNVVRITKMISSGVPSELLNLGMISNESSENNFDQNMIMNFYYDLDNTDKKVFQYTTGYLGNEILSTNEISKKINRTPEFIEIRKKILATNLYKYI